MKLIQSVNFKTDPYLYKEAKDLFNQMGLNVSAAINAFLIKAVETQSIPFTVTPIKRGDGK